MPDRESIAEASAALDSLCADLDEHHTWRLKVAAALGISPTEPAEYAVAMIGLARLDRESSLAEGLTRLLNRHCQENNSGTPDFIMAEYLLGCLDAFSAAVNRRESWYGREQDPRFGTPVQPAAPPSSNQLALDGCDCSGARADIDGND